MLRRCKRKNYLSLILKSVFCVASVAIAACATSPLAEPIPVEVWRGGDDGLTSRFADAVETAFRGAPQFALSSGKKPGTLIVTIPSNVGWRQIGNRTQILYSVEFTGLTGALHKRETGSCWEDQLSMCAAKVLVDAKAAAAAP